MIENKPRCALDRSLNSGERQVSTNIKEIDKWHKWRYQQASNAVNPYELIFDCGCGIGYGSAMMADTCASSVVIGFDDSGETLNFATDNYKRRNNFFVEANLENGIPLAGCDMIVAFEVLEHLSDPWKFLKSVKDLKPKMLFISVPDVSVDLDHSDWHYKHYTEKEVGEILEYLAMEPLILTTMEFTKGKAVFTQAIPRTSC